MVKKLIREMRLTKMKKQNLPAVFTYMMMMMMNLFFVLRISKLKPNPSITNGKFQYNA